MWTGDSWEDGTPNLLVMTEHGTPRRVAAHRLAAAVREGPLNSEDKVFRSCKQKECMNPGHATVRRASPPSARPRQQLGLQSGNGLIWTGENAAQEREIQACVALSKELRACFPQPPFEFIN
jgi:hypothetical protein